MKISVKIFSVLILSFPMLSFGAPGAYDWEAEEGNQTEREIHVTRNRSYAGGADEQDLKVQKSLPQPSRLPQAAPQLVKREGAEPDEDAN